MAGKKAKDKEAKSQDKTAGMSDAQVIAAMMGKMSAAPSTKPKGSKDRDRHEMDAGFETFIAVQLVSDAIEAIKDQQEKFYKHGKAMDVFGEYLSKYHSKPEAFDAFYRDATCQFQFRRKASIRPDQDFPLLTKPLVEVMVENAIPFEKKESVPERLIINPLILEDQAALAKLSRALMNANLGFDVIQKQEPVYKYTITDAAYKAVADIKDETVRIELLRALSTPACSQPKLGGMDETNDDCLDRCLQILRDQKILNTAKDLPKKKKYQRKDEE